MVKRSDGCEGDLPKKDAVKYCASMSQETKFCLSCNGQESLTNFTLCGTCNYQCAGVTDYCKSNVTVSAMTLGCCTNLFLKVMLFRKSRLLHLQVFALWVALDKFGVGGMQGGLDYQDCVVLHAVVEPLRPQGLLSA